MDLTKIVDGVGKLLAYAQKYSSRKFLAFIGSEFLIAVAVYLKYVDGWMGLAAGGAVAIVYIIAQAVFDYKMAEIKSYGDAISK